MKKTIVFAFVMLISLLSISTAFAETTIGKDGRTYVVNEAYVQKEAVRNAVYQTPQEEAKEYFTMKDILEEKHTSLEDNIIGSSSIANEKQDKDLVQYLNPRAKRNAQMNTCVDARYMDLDINQCYELREQNLISDSVVNAYLNQEKRDAKHRLNVKRDAERNAEAQKEAMKPTIEAVAGGRAGANTNNRAWITSADVEGADSYSIYESDNKIADVTTIDYVHRSLTALTTYYYSATSWFGGTESYKSNIVAVTTTP